MEENENTTHSQVIPIRKPGVTNQQQPQPSDVPSYPTETIELPTKGWFYSEDSSLSSGKVELKMMTAKEEDILTNENYMKKGVVFDKLLQSLIVDKSINYNEILLIDQNSLMMAARRLAYGDKYKVKITCPKCSDDNDLVIDLSTLKDKEIDLNKYPRGINQFDYILPYSKTPITFKLLNQEDQENINVEIRNFKKSDKESSFEVSLRLKYIITSVNGNRDKAFIRKFSMNMLARDAMEFRSYINENFPRLDNSFVFECSVCSHSERMDVPITVQFFWPDSRG